MNRMLTAKIRAKAGVSQAQIAAELGVTERTVRNYLKHEASPHKKPLRESKLAPFKPFIDAEVKENPSLNCQLLIDRLDNMGYQGKISILRDYVHGLKKKHALDAVIRFETEPGRQAQVDWGEFGTITHFGSPQKLHMFVMTLGYSRKTFALFVLSEKFSSLADCHKRAFTYFDGVPEEILYDNMRTAYGPDSEGVWRPTTKLSSLANHFGFTPRRCMIYRPQTKGKVERFIGFVRTNFWPNVEGLNLSLEELNERLSSWLQDVDTRELREFGQTRNERFVEDAKALTDLPAFGFDARDRETVTVRRTGHFVFETNQYSLPADFIGEELLLKVCQASRMADIYHKDKLLRSISLRPQGSKDICTDPKDYASLIERHQQEREEQIERRIQKKNKIKASEQVETCNSSIYDELFLGGES